MRRDTVFRLAVHLKGTDLNFKRLAGRPDQRCMQRLIAVWLGHCNVILKAPRNRLVHLVDDAKRRITVLYRIHDDANRKKIVNLIQRLVVIHHLLVNAEEVLHTPVNSRIDPGLLHGFCHVGCDLFDVLLALHLALIDLLHKILIHLRLQISKREVIQLYLDLADAKARSNRRINIKRLLRNALLLLRRLILERPHVMKAIGKLNQNDADILNHRKEHLAEVLRLHFLLRLRLIRIVPGKLDLLQLGHAVHKVGNVGSELLLNLILGINGILDHVMQKSCRDGLLIHFQVSQNNGNIQRMNDVRLSALALLALMRLSRKLVRLFNHGNIITRVIFAHTNQKVLIQFLRAQKFIDLLNGAIVEAFRLIASYNRLLCRHLRSIPDTFSFAENTSGIFLCSNRIIHSDSAAPVPKTPHN